MLLSKRLLFGAARRKQCRLLSSSCKLWAEKGNDLVEDDALPKWKKKINVQATVLSQTLRQLRSDSENMAEKFGIPDETNNESSKIPGPGNLGLDSVNEKAPKKPEKKRIVSSVLLSSVKRLGVFEKPDAEAQVAAKSRRLNLLEEDEQTWVRNWNRLKPTNNEFEALMEQPGYQYPIDNEVVKESEADVGFQDHVLLDHLISDLPKKGPVRKFMQLVVSGLSKNPHYTVEEKQEHIKWYKDIFSTMSDEEVREMLAKKKRIRGKNKQKAENKSLK